MAKWSEIWNKRFKKPLLADQDWLEPREDIFENILQATEPRKRKHVAFWWIVGFGVSMLLIIAGIQFKQSSGNDIQQLVDKVQEPATSPLVWDANKQDTDNQLKSTNILPSKTELSNDMNPKHGQSLIQSSQKSTFSLSSRPIQKENAMGTRAFIRTESELVSSQLSEETFGTLNRYHLISETESVKGINNLAIPFFEMRDRLLRSTPQTVDLESKKPLSKQWGVSVYAGLNHARHAINTNYAFALAPADFYADDGEGWQLGVAISRNLGSRLDVNLSLDYTVQNYASGHNSELIYHTAQEENLYSQSYDLTLATPFGFVQSDFVLSRSADYESQTTVLDAVFGSVHRVSALHAHVSMDYSLIQKNRWSFAISGGIGASYVLSIHNRLSSVDTQHEFIHYNGGAISKDQESTRRLLPNLLSGIKVSRVMHTGSLFANIQYRYSTRSFFRQDEFSSQLHGMYANIGYQFIF